jgi:hypothetical protein
MDRRKSLKLISWGTLAGTVLIDACKNTDKKTKVDTVASKDPSADFNRMPEEAEAYKKLTDPKFFTDEEMKTIAVLSDIIIPRDAVSGSATDAKVPDFIEFIVKEKPEYQIPMRGGLRWLNLQSATLYQKPFTAIAPSQQITIIDQIAYPKKAKPEMKHGVAFFSLMRNLTASGFYSSEIGTKDIGYMGNQPNQWNGVPDDVLKQYGLSYSEKELRECVSFTKA